MNQKKWLIFDLDDTLIDYDGRLLIKSDVRSILEEMVHSGIYGLAVASFNDSAEWILTELGIRHLFHAISAELKSNADGRRWTKADNVQEIIVSAGITNPRSQIVFLDNDRINCLHVRTFLKVPAIRIDPLDGVSIRDIYDALDYLDGKNT